MDSLPTDLLRIIASHLDPYTIDSWKDTCTYYREFITSRGIRSLYNGDPVSALLCYVSHAPPALVPGKVKAILSLRVDIRVKKRSGQNIVNIPKRLPGPRLFEALVRNPRIGRSLAEIDKVMALLKPDYRIGDIKEVDRLYVFIRLMKDDLLPSCITTIREISLPYHQMPGSKTHEYIWSAIMHRTDWKEVVLNNSLGILSKDLEYRKFTLRKFCLDFFPRRSFPDALGYAEQWYEVEGESYTMSGICQSQYIWGDILLTASKTTSVEVTTYCLNKVLHDCLPDLFDWVCMQPGHKENLEKVKAMFELTLRPYKWVPLTKRMQDVILKYKLFNPVICWKR